MKIAHVVPLRAVGGVERSFSEFIAWRGPIGVEHHTIALGRGIPALLEPRIRSASSSVSLGHFRDGVHIPFAPAEPRERHLEGLLTALEPDLALFWNKPLGVDHRRLPASLPVVYWERGRAWKETDEAGARRFLAGVRAILCNSHASRRFLSQRFGIPTGVDVHVCPNSVRPDAIRPEASAAHEPGGPLRLGFAGRFIPVKGGCLAIHTAAELHRRGVACELHLAGEGPDEAGLRALAHALGVEGRVHFRGLLDDMAAFYGSIDCLLVPSLREPFGLVAAEALANRCAVVATRVDGLAEVVSDSEAARAVDPTLPLSAYPRWGGDLGDVPELVYDPTTDTLTAPRLPRPSDLAGAVIALCTPSEEFAARRSRACKQARERFDFETHMRRVMEILAGIVARPGRDAG